MTVTMSRVVRPLVLLAAAIALSAARASTQDEVRAAFERFLAVQNAHDTTALEALLVDSPQFLWITRGTAVWGREAALRRFAQLYEGTWRLELEPGSLQVVPIADNVAQVHAAVRFTVGAAGQPPETTRFLLNQVLVKSAGAWRVMSIFPIAAPAQ